MCRITAPYPRALIAAIAATSVLQMRGDPALADCPPAPTTYPNGAIEGLVAADSRDSALAMDGASRFIVVFEDAPTATGNDLFVHRFNPSGVCICNAGDACPAPLSLSGINATHDSASIAMNDGGVGDSPDVFVGWIGQRVPVSGLDSNRLLRTQFEFLPAGAFAPVPLAPAAGSGSGDESPSAAINGQGGTLTAWNNDAGTPQGLVYALGGGGAALLRDCDPFCYLGFWRPCVAAASSGFVAVWADAESGDPTPFLDAVMQQFSGNGSPIGNTVVLNDPGLEVDPSSQLSAAVAFDGSNIVVVWLGDSLAGCDSETVIFARRFAWNPSGSPIPQSGLIRANAIKTNGSIPLNPTVALAANGSGRFIVAWNHESGTQEVHAQYFAADGRPRGGEFRLNQDISAPPARRLARSAQHTLAYGPDETVAATWTQIDASPQSAHFTILPPGFVSQQLNGCAYCDEHPECCDPCLKGDLNADCKVNGDDIEPFLKWLFYGPNYPCASAVELCVVDLNWDGLVNAADNNIFIQILLGLLGCDGTQGPLGPAQGGSVVQGDADCNGNGIPDQDDLGFDPAVLDLNGNLIPDECEELQSAVSEEAADEEAAWAALAAWASQWDYSGKPAWEVGYEIKRMAWQLGLRPHSDGASN